MGYLLVIQIVIGVQDVVHAVFNSPIIQSDILQVHEVQLKDHQVLWVVSPHLGEVCLILHDPDHHIEHFEALVDLLHKGSLHQTLGVLLAAGVVELVVDVEFNEVGVVLFGHVGADPVFDILAFCFLVVLELRHQQLLLKIRRKKLRDQSMDDDVAFELKDPALGGYSQQQLVDQFYFLFLGQLFVELQDRLQTQWIMGFVEAELREVVSRISVGAFEEFLEPAQHSIITKGQASKQSKQRMLLVVHGSHRISLG